MTESVVPLKLFSTCATMRVPLSTLTTRCRRLRQLAIGYVFPYSSGLVMWHIKFYASSCSSKAFVGDGLGKTLPQNHASGPLTGPRIRSWGTDASSQLGLAFGITAAVGAQHRICSSCLHGVAHSQGTAQQRGQGGRGAGVAPHRCRCQPFPKGWGRPRDRFRQAPECLQFHIHMSEIYENEFSCSATT